GPDALRRSEGQRQHPRGPALRGRADDRAEADDHQPAGRVTGVGLERLVFDVADIGCDACRRAIEGEVSGVAGVRRVRVGVSARTVVVGRAAAGEAAAAAFGAAADADAGLRADWTTGH